MTNGQVDAFIAIIVADAAAATPGTPQAEFMYQLKKALRKIARAVAVNQSVSVSSVVDALTIDMNEASAALTRARAEAQQTVAQTHSAEVDALVAAAEGNL